MNTITLFFIFIPILVVILLIANLLLAAHRPDSEKVTSYECGYATIYGQTRNPFQISFYLVGILFLVFDLEILIIYPYASCAYNLQSYGFWVVIVFFLVLTVGFVYEFGSGALYFTDKRSSINSISNVTDKSNSNTPFYMIQKRAFSTLNTTMCKSTNTYFNEIYEKDIGENTSNVHIIARRHIMSGLPTNVNIINKVCLGSITQTELNELTSIKPANITLTNDIKDVQRTIQGVVGIRKNNILHHTRIAGVYIFSNLRTGHMLVGSSINLAAGLSNYFTPKNIQKGVGLIFQDFRQFTMEDYSIVIYIINKGYTADIVNSGSNSNTIP